MADHSPSSRLKYWQMLNMLINLKTLPWCVISKVKNGRYKVTPAGAKYTVYCSKCLHILSVFKRIRSNDRVRKTCLGNGVVYASLPTLLKALAHLSLLPDK